MHDWLMSSLHSLTQLSSRLQPDLPKASYLTFDKSEFIRERLQSNATDRTVPKRKNINELVSLYIVHSGMYAHSWIPRLRKHTPSHQCTHRENPHPSGIKRSTSKIHTVTRSHLQVLCVLLL